MALSITFCRSACSSARPLGARRRQAADARVSSVRMIASTIRGKMNRPDTPSGRLSELSFARRITPFSRSACTEQGHLAAVLARRASSAANWRSRLLEDLRIDLVQGLGLGHVHLHELLAVVLDDNLPGPLNAAHFLVI